MHVAKIELTGDVASDVSAAATVAGYADEIAYLVNLVHRDRDARDSLVRLLQDAGAEGGDYSFDAIAAEIADRRRSRAA